LQYYRLRLVLPTNRLLQQYSLRCVLPTTCYNTISFWTAIYLQVDFLHNLTFLNTFYLQSEFLHHLILKHNSPTIWVFATAHNEAHFSFNLTFYTISIWNAFYKQYDFFSIIVEKYFSYVFYNFTIALLQFGTRFLERDTKYSSAQRVESSFKK